MSEAIKPTPGPWTVDEPRPGDQYRYVECGEGNTFGYVCRISVNGNANALDDALLIADAGNTFAATGLTPSQLVERVQELEEALRDAEEYIGGHTPTNSWGLIDRREDADRRETLEKVSAALSKSLPNTVAEVK